MLNRKIGPKITSDFDLRIRNVSEHRLHNDFEIYELNSGTQEIIKIELVIRAGRVNESKPAVSKAAIKLLREASKSMNAEETANFFDFYGSVFKTESGMEYSSISLICLNKHFNELFPVWLEGFLNPEYGQEELSKYKELNSKKLLDQLSKNDVIAYRSFTETLFGSHHPYGYNTEAGDILSIQTEDLISYKGANCSLANAFLVLSGKYDDRIRDQIFEAFSNLALGQKAVKPEFPSPSNATGEFRIRTNNELQTNLKLGQIWVPRNHPDYVGLKFLNTILGGYFGSRLMKNIREEKGFTYGIYSAFDAWQEEGYFYVSSDVGSDYLDQTIDEIHKEINILKSNKIGDDELNMVRNYLLGQSLNLIDGPFATAQLVKSLKAKELNMDRFELAIEEIKSIDAQRLMDLSHQYLNTDSFTQVLVGG